MSHFDERYRDNAPGSERARDDGCRCPVMDNAHGKGWLGGVPDDDGNIAYVISGECPLHAPRFAHFFTADGAP